MAKKKMHKVLLTPELEDQELKALAYKQARKMLEAGTAPPSVLTYFLNKGSEDSEQARRIKEAQISVLSAKAKNLEESHGEKQMFEEAIEALKNYDYNNMTS